MAHALHRSWRPFLAFGLLVLSAVGPVTAQATDAPPLMLRNVHMLEGPTLSPRLDVSILVEEGRIRAIGPADMDGPAGAREIDLEGYWVVPGLIDAHSHLASLDAARRALESGVTTVRTAGVSGFVDVAIRDAVRSGALPGPDILAAGIYVTPRIGDAALGDPRLHRFLSDDVDTEEELRALVALNAEYGADWIKTRGTERAGLPETDPREQVYT
ncbi:MAG: amidohydrolase family protein, partial [Gemmatimonadetes bacterium]|nr:amidohydrolase family protein [Gemmatimonadota bacterium]